MTPSGRLIAVIGPYDSSQCPTTTYSYNNLGGGVGAQNNGQNVTVKSLKQTGINNYYTKATYFDGFGREISTRSDGPSGPGGTMIGVDTQYDTNGRICQKSYPYFVGGSGNQVQYTYDGLGRLTKTAYPDQTFTTVAYSQTLTTYTDRNGNQKVQQRDAFGRTTQVTEFLSQTVSFNTTYQYDALGNVLLVADAKGNTTGITYDPLSRKVRMSDPSMGEWQYGYDGNGNLTSQTDAKGQTISFQYDSLSRPWCKTYPNGATISYSYDDTSSYSWYGTLSPNYGIGKLAEVVDNASRNSSGTTQFFYDKQGRATQVLRTIDGNQYSTQFQYDQLGHIMNIAYPDGDQVNYGYDGAGNMSAVSNSASVPYASFSGYNALGQVGQIAYYNGATTSFSYYPLNNRLQAMSTTTQGNGTVQSFTYSYYNNGNIHSISDSVTPANSQTFIYDGLNRLVTAQSQAYNTINISYDMIGNIQTNADSGNPADRSSEALTYDFDNRVTGINATSFVYDYTGARVKKTTGASITTYVSKLFDITNGTVTKHIFAGGRRIASKSGSGIYYYHPDHLGSLSIATDGNGNQAQAVTYYPFGEVRTNTGSVDLPYKFTGHELDPETGLYYCGARYYDSAQGRFISPDTIVQSPGNPQTLNRYAYAGNNPLSFVDPSGHGFFSFFEDFFAALFGAAITVLTMGAGAPVACMLGGVAAGASDAAMHGAGLIGIVQAGFMGGMMGAIGGGLYTAGVPWQAMAWAGAAIACGTGGVKGLGSFAAGFAGALAGGMLGGYLKQAINSNVTAGGYQNALNEVQQRQALADYDADYYGYAHGTYMPSQTQPGLTSYNVTEQTWQITYGPAAFDPVSYLQAVGFNESYKLDAGIYGGWDIAGDDILNRVQLEMASDEATINNASRLDITPLVKQMFIQEYNYWSDWANAPHWGQQ